MVNHAVSAAPPVRPFVMMATIVIAVVVLAALDGIVVVVVVVVVIAVAIACGRRSSIARASQTRMPARDGSANNHPLGGQLERIAQLTGSAMPMEAKSQ